MNNLKSFDDKVFEIIKSKGGLNATQGLRFVNDELNPVGSKLRDSSPDLTFSKGKWELTGAFGNKEVILKRSATQPISVKYYFELNGSTVKITIKDMDAIGYTSITLDFGSLLGSCHIYNMIGQAFNVNGEYKLWDNDKGQITVSINGTTITISGDSLNINRTHDMSLFANIVFFDTIKDTFKDDDITWEYTRLN